MCRFNDFDQLQGYLDHLGLFRMELGLDRMQAAMSRLGIRPGAMPWVQFVGTNGKGSTASFLESLARHHGMSTGLYTSPHLVSVKERIRVSGNTLPDAPWLESAQEIYDKCVDLGLTYFEFLTLIAVLVFQKNRVDLAIMEAGLGGRYDATTALGAARQVFTNIDLDHTHVLGDTISEIAADKARAIHPGSRVILGEQNYPEASGIVQEIAAEAGARLYRVRDYLERDRGRAWLRKWPEIGFSQQDLGLYGDCQLRNAGTALVAWHVFSREMGVIPEGEKCLRSLQSTFLAGRMQVVSRDPLILLDGAHNPSGLLQLRNFLHKEGIHPKNIIFTCLQDKEIRPMAEMIMKFPQANILVPDMGFSPRGINRQDLLDLLGEEARELDDVQGFLGRAETGDGPILVCGSLYLLGYVFELFPEWLETKQRL